MTDASATALLVMDFQNQVVARLGSADVIDAAVTAIATARAHGTMVGYVKVGFRPGYPEISPNNRTSSAAVAAGARRGALDPARGG